MIDLLHALLLGIIEGITEFLPISSTGHLIVSEKLLGFKDYKDLFAVVIQVGAIAAVIWYYRRDLWAKTLGLFRGEKAAINFWKILVIGTIPAGLLGLLFDKVSESITTPLVVALALIIGGVILWMVDNRPVHASDDPVQLEHITTKQAALIGLGQCIAMIPGVSRSGATIVSGLAVKLNRPTATAFSFYLSIPVLVLASAYKLAKYNSEIPKYYRWLRRNHRWAGSGFCHRPPCHQLAATLHRTPQLQTFRLLPHRRRLYHSFSHCIWGAIKKTRHARDHS
jgi:undecaprenyl-diphosphatase